jgi:DNA-nicking Smr family endonuclease
MATDGRRPEDATVPEAPEEEDEWAAAMRDVKPLDDREEQESLDSSPSTGLAERLRQRRELEEGPRDESGFALDRRTHERLKEGRMSLEGTLDLHGLTQEEALGALDNFLWQAWREGRRNLLIVTGKGTARDGGGVLRSAVPRWLGESSHRERLVGVGPAGNDHGGDGAIYVLLRRNDR